MRAQRLEYMMPAGWFMKSGSGSKKSGCNGMWDETCGRCCYYDECPTEMGDGNDTEQLETLKQILSDNNIQNKRTIKELGTHGHDVYKTLRIYTIHHETHWISTNLGPALYRANDEPTDSKAALIDRSYTELVYDTTSEQPRSDDEFKRLVAERQNQVTALKAVSGLVAMVLIFIKDIPAFAPDLTFATRFFAALDTMVDKEFNIPRPTSRKVKKRNMTLTHLAIEERIVEKFLFEETSYGYLDMQPVDSNGELSLDPWNILQLSDVVIDLHPSVEVILAAWSHGHEYSHATSAHVFHAMMIVASAHGVNCDPRTLAHVTGFPMQQPSPSLDSGIPPQQLPLPLVAPPQVDSSQVEFERLMPPGGATPDQIKDAVRLHERKRVVGVDFMRRCAENHALSMGSTEVDALRSVTNVWTKNITLADSTVITPEAAAGFVFPNATDLLSSALGQTALKKWLGGELVKPDDHTTFSKFGTYSPYESWGFFKWHEQSTTQTTSRAAHYDPSYRTIASGGGKDGTPDSNKRWQNAARLMLSTAKSSDGGIIRSEFGMTETLFRDTLYLISKEDRKLCQVVTQRQLQKGHGFNEAMCVIASSFQPHEPGPPLDDETTAPDIRPNGAHAYAYGVDPAAALAAELPPRPEICGVKDSLLQRRADWLVANGSFPSVMPLVGLEATRRAVFNMCPKRHQLIVNTHAMISHVRLFLEVSMAISLIPALTNRNVTTQIPSALKSRADAGGDDDDSQRTPPNGGSHSQLSTGDDLTAGGSPEANESVENGGLSNEPEPGKIQNLGFSYDMFSIFLTKWAVDRVALDVEDVVTMRVEKNKDLFNMSVQKVVENLPEISTRFPNFGSTFLRPVTLKLATTSPVYLPANEVPDFTEEEIEEARLHISTAQGTNLSASDPAVLRRLADSHDSGLSGVNGSLFSYSAWRQHALISLRARGRSDGTTSCKVMRRIFDSGINLSTRALVEQTIHGKAGYREIFSSKLPPAGSSLEGKPQDSIAPNTRVVAKNAYYLAKEMTKESDLAMLNADYEIGGLAARKRQATGAGPSNS